MKFSQSEHCVPDYLVCNECTPLINPGHRNPKQSSLKFEKSFDLIRSGSNEGKEAFDSITKYHRNNDGTISDRAGWPYHLLGMDFTRQNWWWFSSSLSDTLDSFER